VLRRPQRSIEDGDSLQQGDKCIPNLLFDSIVQTPEHGSHEIPPGHCRHDNVRDVSSRKGAIRSLPRALSRNEMRHAIQVLGLEFAQSCDFCRCRCAGSRYGFPWVIRRWTRRDSIDVRDVVPTDLTWSVVFYAYWILTFITNVSSEAVSAMDSPPATSRRQ